MNTQNENKAIITSNDTTPTKKQKVVQELISHIVREEIKQQNESFKDDIEQLINDSNKTQEIRIKNHIENETKKVSKFNFRTFMIKVFVITLTFIILGYFGYVVKDVKVIVELLGFLF